MSDPGCHAGSRGGLGLAELLVLLAVGVSLLVSLMNLSGSNLSSQDELVDRVIVQDLCMDVAERFKGFKTSWTLPAHRATLHPREALAELYPPVDLRPGQTTLFDIAYLERTELSGMDPEVSLSSREIRGHPGLFLLRVKVTWSGHDGRRHTTRFARYCYAP